MSKEKLTAIGSIEVGCLVRVATDDPPAETAAILRQFNAWRRDLDNKVEQPDPREAALMAQLEAAEKERDALRAKITEMEQQEPVAHVWRCDNGHIHGSCESELLMGQQLYALPGAQGEEK